MKRDDRRQQGLGALELIEQAIHELRAAPPAALASYYLGSLPFVLGLLFFWADMSRSAFAYQHLAGAAVGVAVLFLWMKFWQAVFARNLRASFAGEAPPPLGLRPGWRILVSQASLQPSGLFLLPLAFLLLLPCAWACAFYQNLTALAATEAGDLRAAVRAAARQAALWPRQNHLLLASLFGFGFYVFLNWTTVCLVLPGLVKTLLGTGSVFTRSPFSLLNTTFLAAMLGLTYLSVDPILKAAYALRCFYGESLRSGEDLKAELRWLATTGRSLTLPVLLALALFGAASAGGGAAPPAAAPSPAPPAGVSSPELDRAIREVIQQTKYAWRMPREKVRESETAQPGILGRFFQRVGDFLRRALWGFYDWLENWLRKLFRLRHPIGAPGDGWIMLLHMLLYALLAAVAAALTIFLLRVWRNQKPRQGAIASQPIQPATDLTNESLGAEHLPEDRWMALARQLLERGELRSAARALFLASLAHLAERNLISLARFKSNRDYEHELRRRGHSFPELLAIFSENVQVIDRVWYGLHQVNGELVSRLAANVERIQATA